MVFLLFLLFSGKRLFLGGVQDSKFIINANGKAIDIFIHSMNEVINEELHDVSLF